MSLLESKLNSVAAIAINTAVSLEANYYNKGMIDQLAIQPNADLLGYVKVGSLPTSFLTSGSLLGYARVEGIPTNFLTSGSLLDYITSGSLLGYARVESIPTNFLTSGSLQVQDRKRVV